MSAQTTEPREPAAVTAEDTDVRKPSLIDRLATEREKHLLRSRPVRVLYAAVGFTVLAAGVAMLVLPGPALAVIPIGLFILALEFQWAETMLQRSLEQAERARQKAADTTAVQKVLTGTAMALAFAGFAAWAVWGDVPVLPV